MFDLQPLHITPMRDPVHPVKLQALMEAFGKRIKTPGRIYLTGGATALLHGWRQMTIDVDLKADPEPSGFLKPLPYSRMNYQ